MKIILINDKIYWNTNEWTFLQFCFLGHIENIPRFCYHEQLTVAGNCRMCLIEDIKSLKPIVSCTIIPLNNGVFFTTSIKVKKARESMLEFLLINHPLDCPICCQGGECDLQDLTELVGSDKGRFYDEKRAVLDKNIGPIIKTSMNRCIHCTRCIRFSIEIISSYQLGLLGRGMYIEIGTYLNYYLNHEFQGNLIDICPVGALTSKLKSYNIRSWECENFLIPNIFDPFLDNIRFEIRGNKIIRILPVYNFFWKNEWLSDNYRYIIEKLLIPRVKTPLFKLNLFFLRCSWIQIYHIIRTYFINCIQWLILNKLKYFDFILLLNNLTSFSVYNLSMFLNKQISIMNVKNIENNINNIYLLKNKFKTFNEIYNTSYLFLHFTYLRFNYPQIYLSIINKINNIALKHIFICDDNTIFNNNISLIPSFQLKLLLLGKHNISLFFITDKILCLTTLLLNLWKNWYLNMKLKYNKNNYFKKNFLLYLISDNNVKYNIKNLNFYSNTIKIIYNIDILINILYNTSKIMCIYQGSFMEKTSEIINIILPISFGYELPLLKNSIIKHMINLYKFTNNSIKKIRHIIWNNNNLKTSEDSKLLLFQIIFLNFLINHRKIIRKL